MKQHNAGQYFCVSLDEIKSIARQHLRNHSVESATSDTFSTYVILCRGAGKDDRTSWTAHSVRKRTHMTLKRAEYAIDWLMQNRFIAKVAINTETTGSDAQTDDLRNTSSLTEVTQGREYKYQYEIVRHHTGQCVYLPNSIIDGQPGHLCDPALKRLLERSEPDLRAGINISDARTDALLLLLQLYSVHNLDVDGGVKPNIWQCAWTCSKQKEDFECFRSRSSIGDEAFDFFMAQAGQEVFNLSLIGEMFTYIEDETQRNRRVERASKNLRELRFIYQVVQVWGGVCNSGKTPTLQYPLHIFDRAQRDQDEPAAGPNIDLWLKNRLHEIGGISEESNSTATSNNGVIDAGYSSANPKSIFFLTARGFSFFPLTSLRLRYRPHDEDTTAGIKEQRRLAEIWQANLESLSTARQPAGVNRSNFSALVFTSTK